MPLNIPSCTSKLNPPFVISHISHFVIECASWWVMTMENDIWKISPYFKSENLVPPFARLLRPLKFVILSRFAFALHCKGCYQIRRRLRQTRQPHTPFVLLELHRLIRG